LIVIDAYSLDCLKMKNSSRLLHVNFICRCYIESIHGRPPGQEAIPFRSEAGAVVQATRASTAKDGHYSVTGEAKMKTKAITIIDVTTTSLALLAIWGSFAWLSITLI
jgi:hypothetical protein